MTEALFHTDAYVRDFEAVVTAVEGNAVALDRTAFFPGGGGQPHDVGTLSADGVVRRVVKTRRDGALMWHELEPAEPPPIGARVTGSLDWERRHALMRTHTALHVLCGIIYRDFGASVTGSNMTPLAARMDFELDSMSADFAERVEASANAETAADRPVAVSFMERDAADRRPELIRTKVNLLPHGIRKVRVVDIQGLDVQADGGTHVASTAEVGRIKVVGHESKGRSNKRLRIEVTEA